MSLLPNEELVITSISKMRRMSESDARKLQGAGVKIDFVIGVSDNSRASLAQNSVNKLAQGSPQLLSQFSRQLDQELSMRGKQPVRLPANAIQVAQPKTTVNQYANGGGNYSPQMGGNSYQAGSSYQAPTPYGSSGSNDAAAAPEAAKADNSTLLAVIIGAFVLGFLALACYMTKSKSQSSGQYGVEQPPDGYASKVASLDNQWQHENQGQQYQQQQAGQYEGGQQYGGQYGGQQQQQQQYGGYDQGQGGYGGPQYGYEQKGW